MMNARRIHIQLQPALLTQLDVSIASQRLSDCVPSFSVTACEGDGFINFNAECADIEATWMLIKETLGAVPDLATATIVVCEGDNGWDDYLLLHHFDPREDVDTLTTA